MEGNSVKLKTYQAYTMAQALAAVKRDLGEDAVILNTRTFQRGGVLGIGRKTIVEVTATPAADARAANQMEPQGASARQTAAQRAYTEKAAAVPAANLPRATVEGKQITPAQEQQLRTQRLAMAMDEKNRRGPAPAAPLSVPKPVGPIARTPTPPPRIEPRPSVAAQSPAPATASPRSRDTFAPASTGGGARIMPTVPLSPASGSTGSIATAARRFVISGTDGQGRTTLAEVKPKGGVELRPESAQQAGAQLPAQARSQPAPAGAATTVEVSANIESSRPHGVLSIAASSDECEPALDDSIESQSNPSLASIAPVVRSGGMVSSEMQDELAAIRAMVSQVLQRQTSPTVPAGLPTMPAQIYEMYLTMIRQDLSTELADQIAREVRSELTELEVEDAGTVRRSVSRHLAALIPVAPVHVMEKPADGRPLTIALVGPTGVGKTTTLAKLAATFKLRLKRSVGMITSDTYRIAAVEQLKTYADIIGVPLEVVLSPSEMEQAIGNLSDCDVILIDTAGRSQNDTDRLSELKAFIGAANPHEVHLVLSGTAGQRVLLHEARAFSEVGVHKIVLTKLDEAVSFGMLVNVIREVGKQLSFFTTGQEVPEHLEIGKADRLAGLVLGEPLHS